VNWLLYGAACDRLQETLPLDRIAACTAAAQHSDAWNMLFLKALVLKPLGATRSIHPVPRGCGTRAVRHHQLQRTICWCRGAGCRRVKEAWSARATDRSATSGTSLPDGANTLCALTRCTQKQERLTDEGARISVLFTGYPHAELGWTNNQLGRLTWASVQGRCTAAGDHEEHFYYHEDLYAIIGHAVKLTSTACATGIAALL
jgi:hypothetical protein